MSHMLEILKIIEGGLKNNSAQVQAYAAMLANKLEGDGEARAAQSIRKKLAGQGGELFSTASTLSQVVPVDRDSRLALGDETFPSINEHQIQLPPSVDKLVAEFMAFIEKAELLADAGVGVSPSMLIYGPPGCGKTELANYIAASLGLPLITARCDTLVSSFLGSTAKNLRSLFDHAASRPCVLFLDEFDAFAKARDDQHELGELKRVVVSLLQNIDALPEGTIMLAATNHEDLLDSAVWRRFNYRVHMPLPNREVRKELIGQFLGEFSPSSLKALIDVTEGFNGAIIEQACKTSIRSAVLNGQRKIDLDALIISLIEDQYRNILVADLTPEEKARKLREESPKLFTLQRLSTLLGISVGKLSKLFTS